MFVDREWPGEPYPGEWPGYSFVHLDGVGRRVVPDSTAFAGWRVLEPDGPPGHDQDADCPVPGWGVPDSRGAAPRLATVAGAGAGGQGVDLDDWLAGRGAAPLAGRVPVLTYGSNRCPSKITWLRERLGLTGPVVVLAVRTEGIAAVWAAGSRVRDGQRPAVLAAAPGVTERHAVWLATPEQVAVLDVCEGRGERYRLARPATAPGSAPAPGPGVGRPLPTVRTEDGGYVHRPWCYLGQAAIRRPLLVDGVPVRCADVPQSGALALTGTVAAGDGLDAEEVVGAPHPDQWPAALFAYGLLRPGRAGWPLVAPYAGGEPGPATAAGTVHDTGLGRPALLLEPDAHAAGTIVPLTDPAAALPIVDQYEGADYRRVRIKLADDTLSWAHIWIGDRAGLRPSTESIQSG